MDPIVHQMLILTESNEKLDKLRKGGKLNEKDVSKLLDFRQQLMSKGILSVKELRWIANIMYRLIGDEFSINGFETDD